MNKRHFVRVACVVAVGVAVSATFLVPTPSTDGIDHDSDSPWLQAARKKATAKRLAFDQPDQALDYFLAQRMPVGESELPVERYAAALRHRAAMPQEDRRPTLSKLGTPQWRQSGPDNIGGRTRDLVFEPGDPDTMFAAAVSGGVWVSRDGAQSWQQAGQELSSPRPLRDDLLPPRLYRGWRIAGAHLWFLRQTTSDAHFSLWSLPLSNLKGEPREVAQLHSEGELLSDLGVLAGEQLDVLWLSEQSLPTSDIALLELPPMPDRR